MTRHTLSHNETELFLAAALYRKKMTKPLSVAVESLIHRLATPIKNVFIAGNAREVRSSDLISC